jgi:hypothetical protein
VWSRALYGIAACGYYNARVWSRALYAIAACSCYSPSPVEGLACSETDRCPGGQLCDPAFHQCAAFPLCGKPAISDAFVAGPACQPWGAQFGGAAVEVEDGGLSITPRGDGQNSGGCTADVPIAFEDGGIFLEVPRAMPAGHGFVAMQAQGGSPPPTILVADGVLSLRVTDGTIASLPYDPAAMRWWRLRPDHIADTIVAEYAADGFHWSRLGVLDVEPPARITLEISAGVDTVDPTPATARLAHLNVCPPRP